MEREVDVATGESVAFSYELAGLGSRFLAVFVDLALQVGVLVVLIALVFAWSRGAPPERSGLAGAPVERWVSSVLVGIGVFFLFLLFFGYFIVFEWAWHGTTPGKRALAIRVVRDGGFPIDFTSSVIRNVVRILEVGLGFYTVSAIATLLSPANRRLGDMAAGTIVVRDARFERARELPAYDEEPPAMRRDDPVVARLSPAQRDLVRHYAERRDALEPAARARVATDVAAVVRPLLAVPFEHLDDDDLLVHLATTALAPNG